MGDFGNLRKCEIRLVAGEKGQLVSGELRKNSHQTRKFSHQTRKFFDLGGKKWVKIRKNLQKCELFYQKFTLFDPVFCTPLRKCARSV